MEIDINTWNSTPYPAWIRRAKGQCVYALWRRGRVVYVGATKNLSKRLYEHHKGTGSTSVKAFDKVSWLETPDADTIETFLVEAHQPAHNKTPDGKLQRGGKPRVPPGLAHWYA